MGIPKGYQERFIGIIKDCRALDNGKRLTVKQLSRAIAEAKRAPDLAAEVKAQSTRLYSWLKPGHKFKAPMKDTSFYDLALVDPKKRTALELRAHCMGQPMPRRPLSMQRIFQLVCGGYPVHQIVANALAMHGKRLDESGIDFFIERSPAVKEERIELMRRYLARRPVASEAMAATYPCIATSINRLMELDEPEQLDGDMLSELDEAANSSSLHSIEAIEPLKLNSSRSLPAHIPL